MQPDGEYPGEHRAWVAAQIEKEKRREAAWKRVQEHLIFYVVAGLITGLGWIFKFVLDLIAEKLLEK